jgi:long-chain acyl-CoA synthetase
MIVGDHITRAVRRFPDATAVICGGESYSFRELDERTNRLGNAMLALGLCCGDRIVTLLENSVRCVEVDFALAKAGLVRVSLNPRSTAKDVRYILEDSDARAIIVDSGLDSLVGDYDEVAVEYKIRIGQTAAVGMDVLDYYALINSGSVAPLIGQFDSEQIYCLFYTSGTTGRPKGVMLSHRAILHVAFNLLMDVGPSQIGEKILLIQPMSHGAGFFVLPWLMRGGTSIIMRDFDPAQVLRLMKELAIETVKLIPTMIQRILQVDGAFPIHLPHLRRLIYGASPMPTPVLRDAISKFGLTLVQIYGQSEAPVTISTLSIADHDPDGAHPNRLASAGVPFTTVDIGIIGDTGNLLPPGEAGEVVVRAPHLMSGYWKLPELYAKATRDGWLHTSDYGRIDENGYLFLLGRKDEMIISGGYNVAPFEVEEALYLHPAVREAAVVGEPDPEWGSAVTAYVALRTTVSETEFADFLKVHLGFKRPKRIYYLDVLPKNANGKIQKSALKPELARKSTSTRSSA